MILNQLTELGLSQNEAKVYLALLKLGTSTTGPLIKESGLYRVILYDTLEKLIQRGLVTFSLKKNRRNFEAEDPNKLIELVEQRVRTAREAAAELIKLCQPKPAAEGAYVYEGWAGIKAAQENYFRIMQKRSHGQYLMIGASKQLHRRLDDFFNSFHQRRAKLGVSAKLLFNENNREYGELKLKYKPVVVRYLPRHFVTPSWISTYHDLVLIGFVSDHPMAFVIVNKAVADGYRQYFDYMWEQSTE